MGAMHRAIKPMCGLCMGRAGVGAAWAGVAWYRAGRQAPWDACAVGLRASLHSTACTHVRMYHARTAQQQPHARTRRATPYSKAWNSLLRGRSSTSAGGGGSAKALAAEAAPGKKHPVRAGSFLAACTMGRSPRCCPCHPLRLAHLPTAHSPPLPRSAAAQGRPAAAASPAPAPAPPARGYSAYAPLTPEQQAFNNLLASFLDVPQPLALPLFALGSPVCDLKALFLKVGWWWLWRWW